MSRAGYSDDYDDDPLVLGRWRAAVQNAMRGRRGQAFLRELLAAMDGMDMKRLVAEELECAPLTIDGVVAADGDVCALGAVGRLRKINMDNIDPEDVETVAGTFGIADAMTREIVWRNDEGGPYRETPEQRFTRMRNWVAAQIVESTPIGAVAKDGGVERDVCAEMRARCPHCGGTGEVHRQDGEWLGFCDCLYGAALRAGGGG